MIGKNMGDSRVIIDVLRSLPLPPLRGAEIGVFRGETSAALLREFTGLHLFMCDSWRTYPVDHPYRESGDGCARFTQEQQDENAMAATAATDFAAARRTILRLASTRAAELVLDGSLGLVFADGDHTLDAVRHFWRP